MASPQAESGTRGPRGIYNNFNGTPPAPPSASGVGPVAATVNAPAAAAANAPSSLNELHAALRNNGQNSIGGLVNSISTKVSGLLSRARDLKAKIGGLDPSTINPNSLTGIIKLVDEFKSRIIGKLNPLDKSTNDLSVEMQQIDELLKRLLENTVNSGTPQASAVAATALTQAAAPGVPVPTPKTTFLGRMVGQTGKRDDFAGSYDINSKPLDAVLADIETNIWKGYVYPSKGLLSSSKPTERELELIKKVIYKINEKLQGSPSLEDKKKTLYGIFNRNPEARSFLEHTIRYFSDTVPLYSFLTENLLKAGVIVKNGGTPSLAENENTIERNSTQNGFFGTKSTVIPDKDKNNKGWIELFKFLSTAGTQKGGSKTRSKSKTKSKSTSRSKSKSKSKSKAKSKSKSKSKAKAKTQRR